MKPGAYTVDDLSVVVGLDKKDKKLPPVAGNGKWILTVSSRVLLAKESHDLPVPEEFDLTERVRQLAPCLLLLKTPYREKRAYLSFGGVKLFWFDWWVSTTTKFAECSLLTNDELARLAAWTARQEHAALIEEPDEHE